MFEKVRKGIVNEELKIREWTRPVRITEMEFGDDFECMSEFISQNP
jgi:hypothetical protein